MLEHHAGTPHDVHHSGQQVAHRMCSWHHETADATDNDITAARSAAFWNGSENFAVCAVGVCKVRCPLRILFGAIETNSGCRKKPRPILLCLPLVSQTLPLLHFCAAEKKKPFPRRHATTEMRTRIKITMIVRARPRANVSVYLTEIPLAQHELGRETTDRNKRFCDSIFRKMNTVAKPRTTVQMLSTAVRVFSEK